MRGSVAALATPVGDSIEQINSFKAPLLNRILDNPEDPERRSVILDLGSASQALFDRLSTTRPCRIEVADLVNDGGLSELDRIDSLDDADDSDARDPARILELLPPANEERLDLILCWDLPNYLTLGSLKRLIDSISGRSWLRGDDPRHSMWLQNRFDEAIRNEVVPAIRQDCRSGDIEIISAGASIGAFWALEVLCRHPDVFRAAVAMSGTYDLARWRHGHWSDDYFYSSPLHFLPGLDGPVLDRLRTRFVILATGSGAWEDPGETWRMARALGDKAIANRVDVWSEHHRHDWPTWHEMLPLYLDDLAS